MQKNTDTRLEQALAGEYEIDIKAAIKEGWEKTGISRGAMLQGLAVVIVISITLLLLIEAFTVQNGLDKEAFNVQLITNLLLTALVAPFAAALVMMGVDTSVGKATRVADVFQFVSKTVILTITAILTSAIVQLGLLLFIIPGLYMIIATGFAVPLVLDRKLLPAQAIISSIKVVNHQWLEFVKLYAMFFLLAVLVIVTFGIALIWVAPFYYNVKGVLYREIFGVYAQTPVADNTAASQSRDDVFDA